MRGKRFFQSRSAPRSAAGLVSRTQFFIFYRQSFTSQNQNSRQFKPAAHPPLDLERGTWSEGLCAAVSMTKEEDASRSRRCRLHLPPIHHRHQRQIHQQLLHVEARSRKTLLQILQRLRFIRQRLLLHKMIEKLPDESALSIRTVARCCLRTATAFANAKPPANFKFPVFSSQFSVLRPIHFAATPISRPFITATSARSTSSFCTLKLEAAKLFCRSSSVCGP
jgi:hypothetical protein